jgi:hypothetical protein
MLGPALRNRSVQSVVDEALSINKPDTKGKNKATTANKASHNKTGILRSNAPEIAFLSADELLKAMEPSATAQKKHIPQLDGHEQYRWDQEVMLKTVFRKLDARRRGFITLEDVGQIASNVGIQQLLAFTVFGAWVKKKMWKKFVVLCDTMDVTSTLPAGVVLGAVGSGVMGSNVSAPGGGGGNTATSAPNTHTSNTSPINTNSNGKTPGGGTIGREFSNRERTISAQQWLTAAFKVAREYSVSRVHIRTDAEHRTIIANEQRREDGEITTAAWFAEYSRQSLQNLERHANVLRTIQEGDCVWGLHGRGTVWMPAIVERVVQTDQAGSNAQMASTSSNNNGNGNAAKTSSKRRNADSVVFDISYFMSNDALQSARAMESARKLLDLPGNRLVNSASLNNAAAMAASVADPQQPPPLSLASMAASTASLVSITNPISTQRPVLSERLVVEAVFDEVCRKVGTNNNNSPGHGSSERLVGSPSAPSVPTAAVIKSLLTEASVMITIKLSAALSALFQNFDVNNNRSTSPLHFPSLVESYTKQQQLPLLLQGLQSTFPQSVNKIEFVEYCTAALELSVFKTVLQ